MVETVCSCSHAVCPLTLCAVAGVPALAQAEPADAASCWTTTYSTTGKGTCDGQATWMLTVNCHWELQKKTGWVYQSSGRTHQYAYCGRAVTGVFITQK